MEANNVQRFTGKVAVIVGATRGIGYAIAERLAREGASIIISSRKKENVEAATTKLQEQGLDVTGVVCHVGTQEDRCRLLDVAADKFGRVDILMINAGINPVIAPVLYTSENAWDKCFNVNVKAPFQMTKDALPLIKKSQGGRIIYMGTAAGFVFSEQLGAYAISKVALMTLTKYIATELGEHNITTNCVVPGYIDTKFAQALIQDTKTRSQALSKIPLARIGTPEEVASLVAFLASDEAAYISGENIVISGAMQSRL